MSFYTAIGEKPIRINKEDPGHVANRLQTALWREMFHLVSAGVATVDDIDTAHRSRPGAALGPARSPLDLHASGGDGGITHVLEHLGPAMRDWAATLGEYPATDDYIEVMSSGVEPALAGTDWEAMLRERDELLIELIAAKEKRAHLPSQPGTISYGRFRRTRAPCDARTTGTIERAT